MDPGETVDPGLPQETVEHGLKSARYAFFMASFLWGWIVCSLLLTLGANLPSPAVAAFRVLASFAMLLGMAILPVCAIIGTINAIDALRKLPKDHAAKPIRFKAMTALLSCSICILGLVGAGLFGFFILTII